MKIPTVIAILSLGLLMWVEAASAQTTHLLKVSRHRDVALSEKEVDKILADASKLLKDADCDVTFKRDGPIRTFASSKTPARINTRRDRDAVYSEDGDVKVLKEINFCTNEDFFEGCAYPPQHGRRSMIVVHPGDFRHILWAHEFGHRTGLRHRSESNALMTICELDQDQVQVNRRECNCFLAGPGKCKRGQEPPNLECTF